MEFTFNNKSSRDFNIKIKKSNHLSIPRRKLEFVEVQGRTDSLIIDEGAREMLDIEIEAYIDCRNEDTYSYALRVDEWLNGSNAEAILPINQLPKLLGLDKLQNNNGIALNIENFNNNTDKDIEYLANELAFYMRRKSIGIGGAY